MKQLLKKLWESKKLQIQKMHINSKIKIIFFSSLFYILTFFVSDVLKDDPRAQICIWIQIHLSSHTQTQIDR